MRIQQVGSSDAEQGDRGQLEYTPRVPALYFALPGLLKQFHPVPAAVIPGVIHSAWHLHPSQPPKVDVFCQPM